MKLYLSSIGIKSPQDFYDLVGKNLNIKTALITNAFDYKNSEDRKIKYDLVMQELTKVGLVLHDINLRDYNDEPERLKSDLINFDVIWICGGNVFLLRQYLKHSGLDKVLKEILDTGVVYGGDSAGAVVVGPSLEGFDRADHTDQLQDVIFEGLRLVDFVVVPHNGNPKFQPLLEEIIRDLSQKKQSYEIINDNQAVVVDQNKSKIVGF